MNKETTSCHATMVDGNNSSHITNGISTSVIAETVMAIGSTNIAAASLAKDDRPDQGTITAAQDRAIHETRSSESLQSKSSCSSGASTAKNDSANERIEAASCEPTADQARRASTTSRFKEKRPEPLKLSSNMNQDIPLDLSVKSAGNIPSDVLGNIFNLDPLNPMAPLETPRIQWQDNDSLLASTKSRLFSSSTNASHRARISSVMGESPPITPNTPLMDVMFSSTAAASIHRLPSDPSYSAILALESPLHSFLTSPFDLDKLHILDKLSQPSKQDYQLSRVDVLKGIPRRSCSSDNLQYFAGGLSQVGADDVASNKPKTKYEYGQASVNLAVNQKKNSISPLATRSFSNTNGRFSSPTKFSYTNQQSTTNSNESHLSQTSNSNGKSLTPTSAATVNLFNIHLNSPNGSSRQSPVDPDLSNGKFNSQQKNKSPSFTSLDQEASILDMPSSMLYSYQQQQQQNSSRGSLLGCSLSSNGVDQNNNQATVGDHRHRQQSSPSISSTATLNTPTLISPSQMIANQLGLLPSPTLSPISSVFDIPSPFLMFSSSAAQANLQQSLTSTNNEKCVGKQSGQNQKIDAHKRMKSDLRQIERNPGRNNHSCQEDENSLKGSTNCTIPNETIKDRTRTDRIQPIEHDLIKNDLSQLITSAEEKTAACSKSKLEPPDQDGNMDHDVDMEIGDDNRQMASSTNIPARETTFENETRPSTVIPHICISYHTHTKSLSNLQEDQPKASELSNQPLAMSDSDCLDMLESNRNGVRNHSRHRERNLFCKRSLSPRTFHARVRSYHTERLESSSAPPDVHQRRRRSKIKTATAADSCLELTNNKSLGDKTDKITLITGPISNDKPLVLSQSTSCLHQTQSNRNPDRPYPEMPARLTTSNHQSFASQTNVSGGNSFWNGRSSSAGPAIYAGNHSQNKTVPGLVANGCPENLTTSPAQLAGNPYIGQANLNFTGQQGQGLQSSSQLTTRDAQLETNYKFQGTNLSQEQLHYHSPPDQHFQSITHANNYDDHHHHHHHHHHHRPYNAQQLYSMSAGELQRLQYSRSGYQTQHQQIASSSARHRTDHVAPPQGVPSYHQNHQQIQNHNQNIQQQSFHHEGIQVMPVPVGSITNWSTASNRSSCDPLFSDQNPNLNETNTRINRIGLQPAMAQILCEKFDTSNPANPYEPLAHVNAPDTSPSKGQASVLACSNLIVTQHRSMNLVDQPSSHMIDIESRSESRSNSSLDFASSFAGSNGSRSNSAASSNLSARKYHCDQCSKSFTRSDMLTRHRRLHSGDRPFQCTECKQEFSRSDHLSTHMRTHTGEKPYKCKLCTYSACRKDMITRHLKVHNRSSNLAE